MSALPRHAAADFAQPPQPSPDAGARTVHVRCGSDIRAGLRRAGFAGSFLEFADPCCQGPVPAGGNLLAARAAFLAACTGRPPPELEARLQRELAALRGAGRYERITLWFEHDSHDQLILARVLAELAELRPDAELSLICIDRFPGVARFLGLGQLSPAQLRSLWPTRRRVTAGLIDLGRAVWAALQEPAPLALHGIVATGTPELPVMAPALRRHLQELPWTGDGLSLTQRLALQALSRGPRSGAALFRELHNRTEPLPFLGDLLFWHVLSQMQAAGRPPLTALPPSQGSAWPQRQMALTEVGQALLAGELDWQDCAPPERWVGGIRLAAAEAEGAADRLWRWDPATARPALASPAA